MLLEGMTNASDKKDGVSENGIADNAAAYAASLKASIIQKNCNSK
jgi:hypothetical protein